MRDNIELYLRGEWNCENSICLNFVTLQMGVQVNTIMIISENQVHKADKNVRHITSIALRTLETNELVIASTEDGLSLYFGKIIK